MERMDMEVKVWMVDKKRRKEVVDVVEEVDVLWWTRKRGRGKGVRGGSRGKGAQCAGQGTKEETPADRPKDQLEASRRQIQNPETRSKETRTRNRPAARSVVLCCGCRGGHWTADAWNHHQKVKKVPSLGPAPAQIGRRRGTSQAAQHLPFAV